MCQYHYAYFSACQHQAFTLIEQCRTSTLYHLQLESLRAGQCTSTQSEIQVDTEADSDILPLERRSSLSSASDSDLSAVSKISVEAIPLRESERPSASIIQSCGPPDVYADFVETAKSEMQRRTEDATLSWTDPNAPICRSPYGDAFMKTISSTDDTLAVLKDLTTLNTTSSSQCNENRAESNSGIGIGIRECEKADIPRQARRVSNAELLMAAHERAEKETLAAGNHTCLSIGIDIDVHSVKKFPPLGKAAILPTPVQDIGIEETQRKSSWAQVASLISEEKAVTLNSLSENSHLISDSETVSTIPTTADEYSPTSPHSLSISMEEQTTNTVRFSDEICFFPLVLDPPANATLSQQKNIRNRSNSLRTNPSNVLDSKHVLNTRKSTSCLHTAYTIKGPSEEESNGCMEPTKSKAPTLRTAQRATRRESPGTTSETGSTEKSTLIRARSITQSPVHRAREPNYGLLADRGTKAGEPIMRRVKVQAGTSNGESGERSATTGELPRVTSPRGKAEARITSPTQLSTRGLRPQTKSKTFSSPTLTAKMSISTLNRLAQPKHITPKCILNSTRSPPSVHSAVENGHSGANNESNKQESNAPKPIENGEENVISAVIEEHSRKSPEMEMRDVPITKEALPEDIKTPLNDTSFGAQFEMLGGLLSRPCLVESCDIGCPELASHKPTSSSDNDEQHQTQLASKCSSSIQNHVQVPVDKGNDTEAAVGHVIPIRQSQSVHDQATGNNENIAYPVAPLTDPAIMFCALPTKNSAAKARPIGWDNLSTIFEQAKRDYETRNRVYKRENSPASPGTSSPTHILGWSGSKGSLLRAEAAVFEPRQPLPTEWTSPEHGSVSSPGSNTAPSTPCSSKAQKRKNKYKGKTRPKISGAIPQSPSKTLYCQRTILNTRIGVDDQNRPVADTQYFISTTPEDAAAGGAFQAGVYEGAPLPAYSASECATTEGSFAAAYRPSTGLVQTPPPLAMTPAVTFQEGASYFSPYTNCGFSPIGSGYGDSNDDDAADHAHAHHTVPPTEMFATASPFSDTRACAVAHEQAYPGTSVDMIHGNGVAGGASAAEIAAAGAASAAAMVGAALGCDDDSGQRVQGSEAGYMGYGIHVRPCGQYDVTAAIEDIGGICSGCAGPREQQMLLQEQ